MKRRAFTLVELLVVVGIILALAAITLLFLPKRTSRLAADGASTLQTAFASARSRAVRNQSPVGIRMLSSDGGKTFDSFVYIDAADRVAPLEPNPSNPKNWTIYLDCPMGSVVLKQVGFDLQAAGVLAGDTLEIVETVPSSSHKIQSINYATSEVTLVAQYDANGQPKFEYLPKVSSVTNGVKLPHNYRYLKQVRPLMGEPGFTLPRDVFVYGNSATVPSSLEITPNADGSCDIVFSPSGQLVPTGRRIVLWVDDRNHVSKPALITIYGKTGAVAVNPVAPYDSSRPLTAVNSPYAFSDDGRGSGQ